MVLNKEKIVVEDIELSMDNSVTQSRGTLTPFNAAYLPFEVNKSVATALNERYLASYVDANFAKLAGDDTVAFKVALAVTSNEAVPLAQMQAEIDTLTDDKARKDNVLLKSDPNGLNDGYTPSNDYSPATKKYADGLIADKFLGAITGKFIAKSIADGTTNVTVTVINGVITEIL